MCRIRIPAEAVSEVADAQQNEEACVVEGSPAEDLSAVADDQQEDIAAEDDQDDKGNVRKLHSMTKEELRDTLQEILDTDNMEAHKEVTAIKQAFFYLKNRENMELRRFRRSR